MQFEMLIYTTAALIPKSAMDLKAMEKQQWLIRFLKKYISIRKICKFLSLYWTEHKEKAGNKQFSIYLFYSFRQAKIS